MTIKQKIVDLLFKDNDDDKKKKNTNSYAGGS